MLAPTGITCSACRLLNSGTVASTKSVHVEVHGSD